MEAVFCCFVLSVSNGTFSCDHTLSPALMFNALRMLSDFHLERLLLSLWQNYGPDQKSKAVFVANI